MNRSIAVLAFMAACCSALFFGCGGAAKQKAKEASTLKPLVVLYGQFTGQHQGQPPANEEEFKAYVKSVDASFLKSFNVDNAESLFVSPRDNLPYVVVYGQASGPPGPGGLPVVAYEQVGSGGKRYVASSLGAIEEVDEQRFRELVPGGN